MADVQPITNGEDSSTAGVGQINPAFSFPMSSSIPTSDLQHTIPIPSRRPADISILPAPAFTFPPLPSTPPFSEQPSSSPSRPRSTGHRRGPSEFIGGDGKSGLGLLSTSPTKGENALPNPTTSGRRRGHAHRRSAALSHHDLANIIKRPDSISRLAGSAPATPSEPSGEFTRPVLDRARSQPSLPNGNSIDLSDRPESPAEPASPSAPSRPRVGFSDKLEYIPRPLSVISSATSSSVSTVRPEHSLNNSITSLRSLSTSSPPSARREIMADDIFGGILHDNEDDSPIKNWEARNGGGSTRIRRSSPPPPTSQDHLPFSTGDYDEELLENSSQQVPPQLQTDLSRLRGVPELRPRSSPEVNDSKRSKRGKSWTDLLSRKAKPDSSTTQEYDRDLMAQEEPHFDLEDINFDEDSTYVVRSPEYDIARSVNSNPSPSVANFDPDDTDIGPVLDLDEAWHRAGMNSQSESSRIRQAKRAMHSSGATGSFTSANMQYHKRAESAPVMAPVEYSHGFPRYGSNPQIQMADVFEEEEDDYNQNSLSRQVSRQNKLAKQTKLDPLGVNIEEPNTNLGQFSNSEISPKTITTSEASRDIDSALPTSSSDRTIRQGKDLTVKTLPLELKPSLFAASAPENLTSLPIQPNITRNYASSHNSYPSQSDRVSNFHGSNDASPLQTSFDVPRLGTAHSSGTDRSAWSSARPGEHGYPNSTSIDDVPSLVSSSSTVISHIPHTPVVGSRLQSERAQSLTTESFTRPRTPLQAAKRASLASLSKLMGGGSFSEKSKLSIESKAEYDDEVSSNKTKKRHRISRLMKSMFWKSKEDMRSLASRDGLHSA